MAHDTLINEKVKVWAFFDENPTKGTPIFPIAVSWRRRFIKLDRLIFASSRWIGQKKILDLVCAGEGANYELEYNSATYLWKIKRVMDKE